MWHRLLPALAVVFLYSSLASGEHRAARNGRYRRSQACPPACSATCAPGCQGDRSVCKCLLEEVETYPVPGGGYESRYLAERHDDGCGPLGCSSPSTIYLTANSGHPGLPQDCAVGCDAYSALSCNGLAQPMPDDYTPGLAGRLDEIARIVDTHYIAFDSKTSQGCVRAIVHLICLPRDQVIRPNQPARMMAIGYEVRNVPAGARCYRVSRRCVRQCEDNPCQFYVNTGGVKYAVMTSLAP